MSDIRKPPSERQYRQAEIETAFANAPQIYPCATCGWPVASGFICTWCGERNPNRNNQ